MTVLNLKEKSLKDQTRFESRYLIGPESLSLPADLGELKEPVEVYVRILKDNKGYRVFLNIVGSVELECGRCLEVFSKDISQDREKHLSYYPKEETHCLST
ncbi:MAG: hypothetical protein Q9N34_06265 [Aquificota bacterium]|nr:hypothetical protein [Aquificota bacterium]